MKKLSALIAAFIITGVIGFAMFSIGANALTNKNTLPVTNSPTSTGASSASSTPGATQAQIQQMQQVINQYQTRDEQYQQQLNELMQQVNQDNAQVQAYQQLLLELQQRGVIIIRSDGTILVPRG
jgi:peptidoglycan hydrolase CwlO-like protein